MLLESSTERSLSQTLERWICPSWGFYLIFFPHHLRYSVHHTGHTHAGTSQLLVEKLGKQKGRYGHLLPRQRTDVTSDLRGPRKSWRNSEATLTALPQNPQQFPIPPTLPHTHPHTPTKRCPQKDKGRSTLPPGLGWISPWCLFPAALNIQLCANISLSSDPRRGRSRLSSELYILTVNLKRKPPAEGRWAADLFIGLEKPRVSQHTYP